MGASREQKRDNGRGLLTILSTWFFLIALLSCAAVGGLTYYLRSQGIRAQAYTQLETLRDEKIEAIATWSRERAGDLDLAVHHNVYVSYCEAHTGSNQPESSVTATARAALTRFRDAYGYHAVFIASPEGHILLTTETADVSTRNLPLRHKYLKQSLLEHRIVFSDVLISKVHNKPTMFFVSPVLQPGTSEVLGAIGVLVNLEGSLYPRFTDTAYLGETGEILLINRDGIAQSPLKQQDQAVARFSVIAEPARRGAAGETGRIATGDYRQTQVIAAYGFVHELNWGIVVKQDIDELEIPIRGMARDVALVSILVLLLAVGLGYGIARGISMPAVSIAAIAGEIGDGNMLVRAELGGPREIRKIAENLNVMVSLLSDQLRVSQVSGDVYAAAGGKPGLDASMGDVLRVLLDVTESQSAVAYAASSGGLSFRRVTAYGVDQEQLPSELAIDPPDHHLMVSAAAGEVRVLNDVPAGNELRIVTQAGSTQPYALLDIPLMLRDRAVGVIGLASLTNYGSREIAVARAVGANLGQYVLAAAATERTAVLATELDVRNRELSAANDELQARSDELEQRSESLRELADELEFKRVQVMEADRLKSEFLSNMSHELRTPLNSVLALSQLMLDKPSSEQSAKDREYISIIERNGRDLLGLINNLLDLSRIEAGRMDVSIVEFEVAQLVSEVLDTIRPLTDAKGLTLNADVEVSTLMRSDRDKLRQILLNLLGNARKFTEVGSVGIRVLQQEGEVQFSVWDTGTGIPEMEISRVFDEFWQVDGSLARQHQGTGLGLTICLRLAKLLGGALRVESAVGEGSTFVLNVPLNHGDATVGPPPALPGIPAKTRVLTSGAKAAAPRSGDIIDTHVARTQPAMVLVVEDNPIAGIQIRNTLEGAGLDVVLATSGAEALAAVEHGTPTVIVLDLMMPGMDGFELLEQLRSRPRLATAPVIILTAKELTAADRSQLSQNNVEEFLQKGRIDSDQLLAAITRLTNSDDQSEPEGGDEHCARRDPARLARRVHGTPTLLLVEEKPDNMATLKAVLGDWDANLIEATDGEQAVALALSEKPDLILMDIQLPKLDGLQATAQIRADAEMGDVPILALSAKAMHGDERAILDAGCDAYLGKPIDRDALLAALGTWLVRVDEAGSASV